MCTPAVPAASISSIPSGKKLGRIVHGQPQTTNIAFGGDDWKTLYFTTHSTLGSVKLKTAGVPVPSKKV